VSREAISLFIPRQPQTPWRPRLLSFTTPCTATSARWYARSPSIAAPVRTRESNKPPQAEAELKGIRAAGGDATLFQVPETLSADVLTAMHAPPQAADVPLLSDPAQLEAFDAVLFGIPTRYGNFPAQWKTLLDRTGGQWASGAFWGKYAGMFVSTGSPGGGQESTCIAAMSTLAHHGFIYVPLGYKTTFGMFPPSRARASPENVDGSMLMDNSGPHQPRRSPRW
jgi:NAD(P)H dehydrogenase (quinone)